VFNNGLSIGISYAMGRKRHVEHFSERFHLRGYAGVRAASVSHNDTGVINCASATALFVKIFVA